MVDNDDPSQDAPASSLAPASNQAPPAAAASVAQPDAGSSATAHTDPALVLPTDATPPGGLGAPASGAGKPAGGDGGLNAYIQALKLSELDLSDVELPERAPPSLGTLAACAVTTVAGGVGLLILPTTALYQIHGLGQLLLWPLGLLVLAAVALGVRHLGALQGLQEGVHAADAAARSASALAPYWQLVRALVQIAAAAAERWRGPLLVSGIASLAALMVFVLPRDAEWQGSSYSNGWFVAVVAALSCGVLVGRFILVQAEATPLAADIQPWTLPSWFRWVTLALLVAGGLTASFGASWLGLGGTGPDGEFSLAGLGLAVGIGGAIWLARRFDELETKWRAEAANKPPPAGEDG